MAGPAPGLIAVDLDGTLLDDRGRIGAETVTALLAADRAGWILVAVTARSVLSVAELGLPQWWPGVIAYCNGALVEDARTGAPLREHRFDRASLARVVEAIRVAAPAAVFGCDSCPGWFTGAPDGWIPVEVSRRFAFRAGSCDDLLDRPVRNLLVVHPDHAGAGLLPLLRRALRPTGAQASYSNPAVVDVGPAGVDRLAAIQEIADAHGVPRGRTVAFGDMQADLRTLAWAGLGVAMGQSGPDVRRAARLVGPSNLDQGVAAVVTLLLGPGAPAGPFDPAALDRLRAGLRTPSLDAERSHLE